MSNPVGDGPINSRRHPGVRILLLLVVLIPTVSVAFLSASEASSQLSNRQQAERVAQDATTLKELALAMAEMNSAVSPAWLVAYGSSLGIDEQRLSNVVGIDLAASIRSSTDVVRHDPAFVSTPTLRAVSTRFLTAIPEIESGTIPFVQASNLLAAFSQGIGNHWLAVFNQLQADVERWQPPGSFEAHVASLGQTFDAFRFLGGVISSGAYVLEGQGNSVPSGLPPPALSAKEGLVFYFGQYEGATASFAGHLGPTGQAAWAALQKDPEVVSFLTMIQQSIDVAFNGGTALFAAHPSEIGTTSNEALKFTDDVSAVIAGASEDLHNMALAQAAAARSHFVDDVTFLLLLALVSLAGVLVASNLLTRPLKKLAAAAVRIHDGDFDLDPLSPTGPREVVSTITTFNDMTTILKAVESKTVALSTEDLSHPELQVPLPGRTGQALQAAVDRLTDRIRERERQHEKLREEATHDHLTGLLNRDAIFDFLATDVSRRRDNGETVAVLFADLDQLKPLNDTYGHETGDTAILATAEALRQATHDCDVVGRLGGDEFLVVLCAEHSHDAGTMIEGIRRAMADSTISVQGLVIPLQCSVGVALTECDAETDPMELVRQADAAMYEAKRAARAARDQLAMVEGLGGPVA